MQKEWLLAEAKNKLTEVINMALVEPQTIKRRNDSVIVLSSAEYYRLIGAERSFKTHLLTPPHALSDIDLSRDKSTMRNIDL
jgi:PHD/YefM family antitoxin component YafN of YafNO toxin-antitoxin module